jgi:serine protease
MLLRMRIPGFAAAVVVGTLAVTPGPVPVQGSDVVKTIHRERAAPDRASFREGEVIVAFRSDLGPQDVDRMLRGGVVRQVRRARTAARYLASLEPGVSTAEAVRLFSSMPGVEYAEPNGLVHASAGATLVPNDFYYNRLQWNFTQLNAERTWGIQSGKSSVAVAVIDTGVAYEDYNDPNTGQAFRKAPDWGGTVFLPGYDFVNGDTHPNDDAFHGTHVASTIAEATNNAIGVAGLAFGCAIMPIKVLDREGFGTFFELAEGIDYASSYTQGGERPVKVINLSLGSEGFSQTVKSAVDRAVANGVLVVAAAGNSGKGIVDFPANLENVVAVGAVDERKQRASYSNFGTDLDVVAPGGDCFRDDDHNGVPDCIWQQTLDFDLVEQGRYDQFCYCGIDGTSAAAPHVAAVAALLFSQGFTDPAAVRAALEQTAERLGGAPADGRNDTYGFGLVQPAAALPGLGFNLGPN